MRMLFRPEDNSLIIVFADGGGELFYAPPYFKFWVDSSKNILRLEILSIDKIFRTIEDFWNYIFDRDAKVISNLFRILEIGIKNEDAESAMELVNLIKYFFAEYTRIIMPQDIGEKNAGELPEPSGHEGDS